MATSIQDLLSSFSSLPRDGGFRFVASAELFMLSVDFSDNTAALVEIGRSMQDALEGLRVTMGIELRSTEVNDRRNGLVDCLFRPFDGVPSADGNGELNPFVHPDTDKGADARMSGIMNVGKSAALIFEMIRRGEFTFYNYLQHDEVLIYANVLTLSLFQAQRRRRKSRSTSCISLRERYLLQCKWSRRGHCSSLGIAIALWRLGRNSERIVMAAGGSGWRRGMRRR